jgi:dTDP-4-amino-4,6-dideoxygalactose transaminase
MCVSYNLSPIVGRELAYVADVTRQRHFSGDGKYTKLCQEWLVGRVSVEARLTHSCTASLEMAAILANVGPGDEVIMPSFTFVSMANTDQFVRSELAGEGRIAQFPLVVSAGHLPQGWRTPH